MTITNVVAKSSVLTPLNLSEVTRRNWNIEYKPHKFSATIWKHKAIGGTLLLFPNGNLIYLGKPSGQDPLTSAKVNIRRYARILQKQGFISRLGRVRLVTMSATYKLESRLSMTKLVGHFPTAVYEPEVFNADRMRLDTGHFTCFPSGTVIVTGIHKSEGVLLSTLLELELCPSV